MLKLLPFGRDMIVMARRKKMKASKSIISMVMAVTLIFSVCVPEFSISAYAEEAEVEIDTNVQTMYTEFEFISQTPAISSSMYDAFENLNLNYGSVVCEDGKYYLEMDIAYQREAALNESKVNTGAALFCVVEELSVQFEENRQQTFLKNEKIQETESFRFKEVVPSYKDGEKTYYYTIYTAKISLDHITSFDDIKEKALKIVYDSKVGDERTIVLRLKGAVPEKPAYKIEAIPHTYYATPDGSYGPRPGNSSKDRRVAFVMKYPISEGGVTWYYTLGEEEITEDSSNFGNDNCSPNIKASGNEAYTATLRIKGKRYDGSWLDEIKVPIKFSKAGISVLKHEETGVSVIGYSNTIPYDTQMEVERVSDDTRLNVIDKLLKKASEEKYGPYKVFDIKITDPDGEKIALLNETGEWGEGTNFKKVKKIVQFNLSEEDIANGFKPQDCQIYRLKDGMLSPLIMQPTVLSLGYCYGTYSENEDPSGTYVLMRRPLSALEQDTPAGNYKVLVEFTDSNQDEEGNTVEQWFSHVSSIDRYLGDDKNAVICVDETGTKTLYLTLKPSAGKYLSSIRYHNRIAESVEKWDSKYPKVVKLVLTSEDTNAAYIQMQAKVSGESGWQDVTLAIDYNNIFNHEGIQLSAPSITTATGATNFVNDAKVMVSMTADAVDGEIYYTLDGSEPDKETGTKYSDPILLESLQKSGCSYKIKAIAVKDGYTASKVSVLHVVFKTAGESAETVKTPVIRAQYDYSKKDNGTTAESGFYQVEFSTETEGSSIYYTLDGTEPTQDSILYDGNAISVPAMTDGKATEIQAIAVKDGYNDSEKVKKTIQFSLEWWDNLQEGDTYQVPLQMVNIGVYQKDGTKVDSMGAGAIDGDAVIYVEDGKKYLEVSLQGLSVGGFPGYLTGMWYWENNDNNNGENAGRFSTNNMGGAIEASYSRNENGTINKVTIPLYTDFEQVFVGIESNVSIMGKQGTILWLDYSNVIEAVTGKTVEKEVIAEAPTITYTYDENEDSYKVYITAEEGAAIRYSVSDSEDAFDWKDYTGTVTICGKDTEVKDGMVTIMAKAEAVDKSPSKIVTQKLTFADFGKDDEELSDGNYLVNVTMRNAANPEQASMSNAAISNPVQLTVKDGKYAVTADFAGITIELAGQELFGYLKTLSYKDKSGNYADTVVNEYYSILDAYNTKEDGTAGFYYPKQVTFPLVNGKAGDTEEGYIDLQVVVPIMDSIAAGSGTQKVYMDIDWTTVRAVDLQEPIPVTSPAIVTGTPLATETPEPTPTVSGGDSSTGVTDGIYTVNVTMRNASNPAQASMADNAVVKPVTVTVNNGKYTIIADFRGININLMGKSFFGYLKELSYKNANGSYVVATVNSYYDIKDAYNTKADGTIAYQYPKQISFPLVNGTKGDTKEGYVELQVFVPIMEGIAVGTGTQKVYMDIDWSTLKKATGTTVTDPTTGGNGDTENVPTPVVSETPTATETVTPKETQAPMSSAIPEETETVIPSETPKGTETVAPSEAPEETETVVPSETPKGTETVVSSEIPKETKTPVVSETPKVEQTAVPSETPAATVTPSVNGQTGEEQLPNAPVSQETTALKKNQKVTVGKNTYVVTNTGKNATVKLVSTKSKSPAFTVPAVIKVNGVTYKVTAISAKAFKNNKKITSVVIAKNVTTIGRNAFYGAKNLEKIVIKTKSLTNIGAKSLKGISSKVVIKLPSGLTKKQKKALKNKLIKAGISKKVTWK